MLRLRPQRVSFTSILALVIGSVVVVASARASTDAVVLDRAACSSSYVEAHLSWGDKCLRVGQYCKVGNPEYHAYGFDCPASGRLKYSASRPRLLLL